MTPEATRLMWILGLAGGAAAIVGGVAYASRKSSSTSTPKPSKTPAPGATTAAPGFPQTINLSLPGTNYTIPAQYGVLTIQIPPGFYNVSVEPDPNNPNAADPTSLMYNPNVGAFSGLKPTPQGAYVTINLNGRYGVLLVQGSTTPGFSPGDSNAPPGMLWTSTITVGTPSA
jgi:hypothetical protein